MVRNSVDHGMETPRSGPPPASREQGTSGCPPTTRAAKSSSASPTTAAGSNTDRIKAKAVGNGLVSEADLEKMSEAQIHKFIFMPGFSTAAAVT